MNIALFACLLMILVSSASTLTENEKNIIFYKEIAEIQQIEQKIAFIQKDIDTLQTIKKPLDGGDSDISLQEKNLNSQDIATLSQLLLSKFTWKKELNILKEVLDSKVAEYESL